MSPTSPRNLAASTGPTPNSSSRLVLAWTTAALIRASHGGDPLLQLADVGDQVGGQLPVDGGRRTGRPQLAEQRGGAIGG
jgi:hypothetical protein